MREPVLGAQQRAQAQLKVQERVPLAQGLEQVLAVHKARALGQLAQDRELGAQQLARVQRKARVPEEPPDRVQARLKVQEREQLPLVQEAQEPPSRAQRQAKGEREQVLEQEQLPLVQGPAAQDSRA